ncbi:MAG: phosphate ABC transporter substrate-binding protein [Clostridia bacterium]|nr:phosphate ABC transporter substrate-binding protein [Clostridia bacterium]
MRKLTSLKSLILVLAVLFAMTTLFAACGQKAEETKPSETTKAAETKKEETKGVEGNIIIAGSTSVQPLAQELADKFMEANKGVKIDVQGGGSSAGVKAAIDGTADIGTSSRDLKEEEKNSGLTETVICLDGIAVVVNPKNTVSDLKKDDITKIFLGEIKNWKEVGGPDKNIVVVSREAGSGTRGAFEELLKLEKDKKSLLVSTALIQEGNGAVKAAVASKEDAIGYVSLGYLDNTLKAVKVDGVECSEDTIKAKKYAISRPFLMLTKGEMKPQVKAFIDYILSGKGQETIKAKHYITVK